MQKSDINFLNQLVQSLAEANIKLEESYKNKDVEEFNRSKKLMLDIQKRIKGVIR